MNTTDFPAAVASEVARLETEIGKRCREIDRLSGERDNLSRLLSHLYPLRAAYRDAALAHEPEAAETDPAPLPVEPVRVEAEPLAPSDIAPPATTLEGAAPAAAGETAVEGVAPAALDLAADLADAFAEIAPGLTGEALAQALETLASFDEAVAGLVEVVAEAPKRQGKAGNPQHKAWTAEDDTQVAALWNAGKSAKKIAEELGRTNGSVVQRIAALKERGVRLAVHAPGGSGAEGGSVYTAQDDATILRMRAEGKTFAQIGAAVGRTGGAVRLRHEKISVAQVARLVEAQRAKVAAPVEPVPASTPSTQPAPSVDETRVSSTEPVAAESLPALRTMRGVTFHAAPVSPLALVTDAILEVRGKDRPVLADHGPGDKAPPAKPGTGDLRRQIAAHLDALGHADGWSPLRDLDLFEGILAGNLTDTAARLGVTEDVATARFKALCQPIRETVNVRLGGGRHTFRTANSTDGQAVLAELLRERAAQPATVAAE